MKKKAADTDIHVCIHLHAHVHQKMLINAYMPAMVLPKCNVALAHTRNFAQD